MPYGDAVAVIVIGSLWWAVLCVEGHLVGMTYQGIAHALAPLYVGTIYGHVTASA